MQKYKILWIDDEVDMLKPYILFLTKKDYEVDTVISGEDGIELIKKKHFDIVFLDAHMPGISGIETLKNINVIKPNLPIVMVTKIEEESLMEEAIASKIEDYLIKPINPNQILLTLKKIFEKRRLIFEQTSHRYQQEFQSISASLNGNLTYKNWENIYNTLIYWDIEINKINNEGMLDVLQYQKDEANLAFSKFIEDNYSNWLKEKPDEQTPLLSHKLLSKKVFPVLDSQKSTFFILIDNLRLDQWKAISPILNDYFTTVEDSTYFSILPTSTVFCRNAIFAGQTADEISKAFPHIFFNSEKMTSRNLYETTLLENQLKKYRINLKYSYHKIINHEFGNKMVNRVNNLLNNDLNIMIYNFVDILSHSSNKANNFLEELAPDESAYRSLTVSWFKHSYLFDLLKQLANKKVQVIITTDHGTIRVKTPCKIVGTKQDNKALRYKISNNIQFNEKDGIWVKNPKDYRLPQETNLVSYLFAKNNNYFVYSNNEYSNYANLFKNNYHHGGVSLEEIIIPFAHLVPK